MMVPRSFGHISFPKSMPTDLEENNGMYTRRRSQDKAAHYGMGTSPPPSPPSRVSSSPGAIRSDPVEIPTQRSKRPKMVTVKPVLASLQSPIAPTTTPAEPRRRPSTRDLLTATAIPARKRPKGRIAQRLPEGDHVADFSKLLLEDVKHGSDGSLAGSLGNPHFDGLFGNIDELVEGQMIVGSEGVDESIMSTRSVSTESMPSLNSSDGYPSNDLCSLSSTGRRTVDRKLRLLASSEGCDEDHPLMHPEISESPPIPSSPETSTPRNISPSRRPLPTKDRTSTFKSSLSASLRALKYAAQSVSYIASSPPIIQPDDFLTRSFFNIQPALTDDRRPPPSTDVPTPELRRYLNPNTLPTPPDSPRQLHFWQDDRPTRPATNKKKKSTNRRERSTSSNPQTRSPSPPLTIPLQSCIPTIRTANATAPPVWLSPDGTPSNKRTVGHEPPSFTEAGHTNRQREPRENRDFLRVLVAEMNMRRAGKFEENKGGRARMWIEPRQMDGKKDEEKTKKGEERWVEWKPDTSG